MVIWSNVVCGGIEVEEVKVFWQLHKSGHAAICYDPIVVCCHLAMLRPQRRVSPLGFDCILSHSGPVASNKLFKVFVDDVHQVSFFDVSCI